MRAERQLLLLAAGQIELKQLVVAADAHGVDDAAAVGPERGRVVVDIAKAALQIVHTSIVSTIMFAVFGLLILALAVMLLVRAIKLWMYAIFSPLFTFRFVA